MTAAADSAVEAAAEQTSTAMHTSAAPDSATEAYLDLLLQEADDFAQHLQPLRKPQYQNNDASSSPPDLQHPIAGPSWSDVELDLFYRSIARHSKLRPDLIAKDVRTKTLPQVCLYIRALEQGAAELEAAELDLATRDLLFRPQPRSPRQHESWQANASGPSGKAAIQGLSARRAGDSPGSPAVTSDLIEKTASSKDQVRRARARLREQRWKRLPAAKEMNDEWIELEELQASIFSDRYGVVAERLAILQNHEESSAFTAMEPDAPVVNGTGLPPNLSPPPPPGKDGQEGGEGARNKEQTLPPTETDTQISPTEEQHRAMLLYSASLPVAYDEQVAATMLYLRHRPRLDPDREPNTVLVSSNDADPATGDRLSRAPIRAFRSVRAVEAVVEGEPPKIRKEYAAFCATHPASPITCARDVLSALSRAIELGFIVAVQVSDETLELASAEGAEDGSDSERRSRIAKLLDEGITDRPQSTGSLLALLEESEQTYLCWADSLDAGVQTTGPADHSSFLEAIEARAERGDQLFHRARAEARARLLSSLTTMDLRLCYTAYRDGDSQDMPGWEPKGTNPVDREALPPEESTAAPPDASTDPLDMGRQEAGPIATSTAASDLFNGGHGPPAAGGAIDAGRDQRRGQHSERFIYHGEDVGIDFSKIVPEARQSVKARIRAFYAFGGMDAVRDLASRLDSQGRLTSRKPRAPKGLTSSLVVLGHDMGVDLRALSPNDFATVRKRVAGRLQRKGVEHARQYCAQLQERLDQGLSLQQIDEETMRPGDRAGMLTKERRYGATTLRPTASPGAEDAAEDAADEPNDTNADMPADESISRIRRRDNRLVHVGLAEAFVAMPSASTEPDGEASGKGEGEVDDAATLPAAYSMELLPPHLQRAITLFPGIIGMLEESYSAPDADEAEAADAEAEAVVARGPRRISVEALASLWEHFRAFLVEVLFSVITALEPYSLDKKQDLPKISPLAVYSAVARLGYPHSLPGLVKAVRKRSHFASDEGAAGDDDDWGSMVFDEFSRKAMQMDPPICFDEVYRPGGARKRDPDLIGLSSDDDDGDGDSDGEGGDPITITIGDAYRLPRPFSVSRSRKAAQDDEGYHESSSSDTQLSELSSSSDDATQSEKDGSTRDTDLESDRGNDHRPTDPAPSTAAYTDLSEVDTTHLSPALRSKIERFLDTHLFRRHGQLGRMEGYGLRLLRRAVREQEEEEALEHDMLERLERADEEELKRCNDEMQAVFGRRPVPNADEGEGRAKVPRKTVKVGSWERGKRMV
ncbi:uncharacterized protein PFL1_06446 [Pseudozyma flocculosa PF-1]|uniref:SANT domain-containing protein n=1 Tax=Pseudozyma flocculosa PF-1 TaxID=1277687 RepID=A0A061H5Y0_9BASI|nr:uncharacterized protein PFL1_06446 [Pseudozyma flocculosa PF-1]EPQ25991.1 hypothetical protein PFL1_06446 [Pseudozyma flocculosa PF-1]